MDNKTLIKPLFRGHIHQAAFFVAIGAGMMLVDKAQGDRASLAALVYFLSLTGLLGISALYHRPQWSQSARKRMRRLDHAAIFLLIAGTAVPICELGIRGSVGQQLLTIVVTAAALGIFQSLFWIGAPKWLTAFLCVAVGWLVVPYLAVIRASLSSGSVALIVAGGLIYTVGALVYALKRPDPWPRIFGYHEVFHLLVVIAALLHFIVINRLVSS